MLFFVGRWRKARRKVQGNGEKKKSRFEVRELLIGMTSPLEACAVGGGRLVAGDEQRDSQVVLPQIKECTIRASVRLRLSQLQMNVNESLCLLIINGSV